MSSRRLLSVLTAAALLVGCATARPSDPAALVQAYSVAAAGAAEAPGYPYVAEHRRGRRRLAFVAATHTVERDSATQRAVRQAFTRVRPQAVIIEGVPSSLGANPEMIVELARRTDDPGAEPFARGEAGYAASLALAAGVPFQGGEPSDAELTAGLVAQGFDPLDILYTDLLAILPQSIRGGDITGPADPEFFDVFAQWTVALSMQRPNPPRISLEGFGDWYRAQFGVDYRADPLFAARGDPAQATLPGRILNRQSMLRDQHLLGVILNAVKTRGRVLVVYGGTHRTTLARALTAELGPAVVWSPAQVLPVAGGAVAAGSTAPN